MSLQGSLETIALPEVIALLSRTGKSGELEINGTRRGGRLWFSGGKLSGFSVSRCPKAVDAVFELLRLSAGSFSFQDDRSAPEPCTPVAVEGLVAEAKSRLDEWKAIEAVVPSLDAAVDLVADAAGEVKLSAEQWQLVVAVGDGRSVASVLERRKLGEFEGCKAVKSLVDAKLARVTVRERVAPRRPLPGAPEGGGEPVGEPGGNEAVRQPARREPVVEPAGRNLAALAGVARSTAPATASPAIEAPATASPATASPATGEEAGNARPGGGSLSVNLKGQPVAATAGKTAAPASETPLPGRLATAKEEARSAGTKQPQTAKDPGAKDAGGKDGAAKGAGGRGAGKEGRGEGTDRDSAAQPEDAAGPSAEAEGEEPVNRGLLLKFLSSVRS